MFTEFYFHMEENKCVFTSWGGELKTAPVLTYFMCEVVLILEDGFLSFH